MEKQFANLSLHDQEKAPEAFSYDMLIKYCGFNQKGEKSCRQILQILFPGYTFKTRRPSWLKNPDGIDSRLELDCYNEQLQIALEYNDLQHYQVIPMFHSQNCGFAKDTPEYFQACKDNFQASVARDNAKKQICEQQGVTLIIVSCKDSDKGIAYVKKLIYDKCKHLDQCVLPDSKWLESNYVNMDVYKYAMSRREDLLNQIEKSELTYSQELTESQTTHYYRDPLIVTCESKHSYAIFLDAPHQDKLECAQCKRRKTKLTIADVKQEIELHYGSNIVEIPLEQEYIGVDSNIKGICKLCNLEFVKTVSNIRRSIRNQDYIHPKCAYLNMLQIKLEAEELYDDIEVSLDQVQEKNKKVKILCKSCNEIQIITPRQIRQYYDDKAPHIHCCKDSKLIEFKQQLEAVEECQAIVPLGQDFHITKHLKVICKACGLELASKTPNNLKSNIKKCIPIHQYCSVIALTNIKKEVSEMFPNLIVQTHRKFQSKRESYIYMTCIDCEALVFFKHDMLVDSYNANQELHKCKNPKTEQTDQSRSKST